VGFFVRGLRISKQEWVYLELEQSCHFLLQEIERTMTRSGVAGISYILSPGISGVAINEIEDITSEGNLAWEGTQSYFFWQQQSREVRKQKIVSSDSPQTNPRHFTSGELLGFTDNPSSVIGKGVTKFRVANQQLDGSGRLVVLSIELERTLSNEKTRRSRLEKLITILN